MTSPPDHTAPAGWFPDPTGRYQWRYFDGSWTDVVSNDGRTGRSPLPAPAAAGTPTEPPSIPRPGAPPGHRRLLIVAIAAAATVAIVAAITLSTGGGSDDQAGTDPDISGDFCTDFPANYGPIDAAWQTAVTVARDLSASADRDHDVAQLSRAAALTRRLAAEAPNTTDEFGDPLPGVIGNWSDFFAATSDLAADDGSNYLRHSGLLSKAQSHESDSSPSLLKQAMFPGAGLPATRSCG